ncbi:MAG: hypothetical protein M1828_006480 [Chrysothrix sp. TS-e1954]|nr:MAG: hypothetical protein M1828_006480 [Chrysothrix sp. TS-e1954]
MSVQPIITFKAGRCDADLTSKPTKIRPSPTPGYLYLYSEDELIHFCWRSRTTPLSSPELDLMMVPTDGAFQPFLSKDTPRPATEGAKCPIPGRVFSLKFSSSGERHFFWLQSREQPAGERSRFSRRDLRLGEIVDELLQGGEGVRTGEVAELRSQGGGGGGGGSGDGDGGAGDQGDDADTMMEDVTRSVSGGAGADATGGDVREEGEESREGGADGGRANHSTSQPTTSSDDQTRDAALRSLLASIGTSSTPTPKNPTSSLSNQPQAQDSYTTLPDLLPTPQTTTSLSHLPLPQLTHILSTQIPPTLLQLAHNVPPSSLSPNLPPQEAAALASSLSESQQRELLEKVLRSAQFTQSLGGVDRAVRSGGLEGVAEALGVGLDDSGKVAGSQGGGPAVRAFVEGVRRKVEEEEKKEGS